MTDPTYQLENKRDTAANWTSANPVLLPGVIGVEEPSVAGTSPKIKIGDGVTAWTSLPYFTTPVGVANSIARAYAAASTTLSGSWLKIALAVSFDPGNNFSNSQYTCKVAGFYHVEANMAATSGVAAQAIASFITLNGTPGGNGIQAQQVAAAAGQGIYINTAAIVECAVGDTISLYGLATPGSATVAAAPYYTSMSVHMLPST